jgi:hypothetical protein
MSLKHLCGSLIEEAQARYAVHYAQGKHVKFGDITTEVLAQQLMAMDAFAVLAKDMQGKTFEQTEAAELAANKDALANITSRLRKTAAEKGIHAETDAAKIHRGIANTWAMITSNNPFITSDINYRAYSMKKPGAQRGLFAYPNLPEHFSSSPIANFITYTEVPAALTIGNEERSFGFLNSINVDPDTGLGYVVERPHFIHSSRVLALADTMPGAKEKIFALDLASDKNHDLMHHMIQVYADHFQIHHDSAPISNGGYLRPYVEFGRDLRKNRETYELSAGSGYAEIFADKSGGSLTAAMRKEMVLMGEACDATEQVCAALRKAGRTEDAQVFADYVCTGVLGQELLVLPHVSVERAELRKRIDRLNPTPTMVKVADVIAALDGQKLLAVTVEEKIELIDKTISAPYNQHLRALPNVSNWLASRNTTTLKPGKRAEYVNGAFHDILPKLDDETLHQLLARHTPPVSVTDGEYGASVLYDHLKELKLLGPEVRYPVSLKGLDAVSWNVNMGEIQPALRGYYEKIQKLPEVPFGDQKADFFEIALRQQEALEMNSDMYRNRIILQRASELVSHELLMLFVESYAKPDKNPVPVWLNKLLNDGNEAEQKVAETAIKTFDTLITSIAQGRAAPITEAQQASIEALKALCVNDPSKNGKRCIHRLTQTAETYQQFVKMTSNLQVGERGITSKPNALVIAPISTQLELDSSGAEDFTLRALKQWLRSKESQQYAANRA